MKRLLRRSTTGLGGLLALALFPCAWSGENSLESKESTEESSPRRFQSSANRQANHANPERIRSAGLVSSSKATAVECEELAGPKLVIRRGKSALSNGQPEVVQKTLGYTPQKAKQSKPTQEQPKARPTSHTLPETVLPQAVPSKPQPKSAKKETDLPIAWQAVPYQAPQQEAPLPLSVKPPVAPSPHTPHSTSSTASQHTKLPFSGFYAGIGGAIGHLYVKGDLYSRTYRTVNPLKYENNGNTSNIQNTNPDSDPNKNIEFLESFKNLTSPELLARNSIFYGSYAENENTWLASGHIFVGFDAAIMKHLRLGIEVQGARGWRAMRMSANGAYGCRSQEATEQNPETYPSHFKYKTKYVEDVLFGYTRQRIKTPYSFSLTPRIGVPLSAGTLLYAKVGVKCEKYKIEDTAEEDVEELSGRKHPKESDDVIYDKAKPSFVGGIGLEALVTKQVFLRLEGTCSGGAKINLDKDDLKIETTDTDRALESLDIESMRNFSFGLGAGMRF